MPTISLPTLACEVTEAAVDSLAATAMCARPDQAQIAEIPSTRILRMDQDDLVRLIRAAHLPFLSAETDEHLEFRDRQTLVRLAMLARRCFQNRAGTMPRQVILDSNPQ